MFLSMLLSGNIDFMSAVIYISSTLLVIFLVLPFHEWAHGFMAYKLGDNTAKLSGRLTLNPLAHIDPFGSLLLLLIGFGWAKPVPVDARNFKNPKVGMAITAFAGPVANLIAAIGAGLVMHLIMLILSLNNIAAYDGNSFQLYGGSEVWMYVIRFFVYLITINTSLAVFNFIPIPPLDGSKILMGFLPDRAVNWIYANEQIFSIGLFVLVMAGGLNGGLISMIQNFIFGGIYWLTSIPFRLFL